MKTAVILMLFVSVAACSGPKKSTSPTSSTPGTANISRGEGKSKGRLRETKPSPERSPVVTPAVSSGHKHDGQGSEDL
ncbi:hypothetical protein KKF84_16450 [Myxococcota bacterium]|nr:hypothetical protein [Myxococcota bacterium]